MSLKAVHICFIILSIILTAGFGYWGIQNHNQTGNTTFLYLGIGSIIGSLVLVIYLFGFIRKMKKINPLPLWLIGIILSSPRTLFACAVCFGDPNSNLSKGVIAGVLVLLGVVGSVLGGVGAVSFTWFKRAKHLTKTSSSPS